MADKNYPLIEDSNPRGPPNPGFSNQNQGYQNPQYFPNSNVTNPPAPYVVPNNNPRMMNPKYGNSNIPNQGGQIPRDQHGNLTDQQRKYLQEQRMIIQNQFKKHPRMDLPEDNESNLQLGGAYQQFLYQMGECMGQCQPYCPCICCVNNPYQTIQQSYEGIFERFGKYVYTQKSGIHFINPCTDTLQIVDCKTIMIDLPRQWAITKDNIMVSIDAAVYYRVINSRKVVYSIINIRDAVSELTFATLRSVIGHYTLQDLLEKRGDVIKEIEIFVETHVQEWGIDIENMVIKDIVINPELQETLSMAAQEKRLAESKIISAKADVASAQMLREAADILDSKSAMQIRYLQTVQSIATNSQVIFIADEEK